MNAFFEPFWNLDQVKAWAETRDPQLVSFASDSPEQGVRKSTGEIAIRSIARATRLKQDGRDLAAELWEASGLTPRIRPFFPPSVVQAYAKAHGVRVEDVFSMKDLTFDKLEPDGPPELGLREEFPTIDYLLNLFRAGRLAAIANLPGEPKACELSKGDWAGLVIMVGGDPPRLGVRRDGSEAGESGFENVRVEREQVLKVFPPNPVAAQTASSNPENAERSSPRQTGVASTGKPSKVTAVAEALARLFPGGRPSHTRDELLRQLQSNVPEIRNCLGSHVVPRDCASLAVR